MTSESKCPGCTHSLQAFSPRTPSGAGLELERCPQCGGCWGARGRIQNAFGAAARHQLIGGLTVRNCVECRILMTPAVLPSNVTVEVCSACHGMFLDAGELEQLGVRDPGRSPARAGLPKPAGTPRPTVAPPPPPPRPIHEEHEPPSVLVDLEDEAPTESAGTFECVECGQRKPLREGQALRDGLACRACMKARVVGRENDEAFSLGNLFRGRARS
ncbi:zf-TFIIB domain-containing protein [Archangium violaceum]|uniref:zf-TFIIB domain-containing protein n=1 Tax=Archangium violaceum TaxID=83451 RepID=UPI00193BAAF4|nr:zf-TFIIB domain-containing protein [Archangium violaceum]QRK05022.1 zf-TFIIB domain-containing protein [Archangium violaceum]